MDGFRTFAVTGTFHGSLIVSRSEGNARRAFHQAWGGESIVSLRVMHGKWLQKPHWGFCPFNTWGPHFSNVHMTRNRGKEARLDTDLPF